MSTVTFDNVTRTAPVRVNRTWQRAVPVFGIQVLTPFFWALVGIAVFSVFLSIYREVVGLGPASGMNDKFAWGIWKTFNVVALTAWGSGAFAMGVATWVFHRKKLFPLMRMALLTSMLAYACGLCLLGVDVGRPWNFYWVLFPWHWNAHSPMAEIAICMSLYASIPLFLENIPPVLERLWYFDVRWRPVVEKLEHALHYFFPLIVAAAYLLPGMHQSSLGALMLLGGPRVHSLWQTPLLPLLYVGAASFMGFACVAGTTMLCCVMWKRVMDWDVLDEAARITAWIIFVWSAIRILDVVARGAIVQAFRFNHYAAIFWVETLSIFYGGWLIYESLKGQKPKAKTMFLGYAICTAGGLLYRFSPTTLAYMPGGGERAMYFPSLIETLIALGFASTGIAIFLLMVKLCAILPGSIEEWHNMAAYFKARGPSSNWSKYFNFGFFGDTEPQESD